MLWPICARTKATGISSTSWRMKDTISEYMDLPNAWKQPPKAMHAPAMQKLRDMIRRAGMPTDIMVSVALKIFSRGPGKSWKITMPKIITQEA